MTRLLPLLLLLFACADPYRMRATLDEAERTIVKAHAVHAKICAPEELANAEANVAFAYVEFEQADMRRSSYHVTEAHRWAALALQRATPCGTADRDGDGILDIFDRCPDVPGLAEYDGCPPPPPCPELPYEPFWNLEVYGCEKPPCPHLDEPPWWDTDVFGCFPPPCPELDFIPDWDVDIFGCEEPPCPHLPAPPDWDVDVFGCVPPACPNLPDVPDWDVAVFGCQPPPCPELDHVPPWNVSVFGCEPPPCPDMAVIPPWDVEVFGCDPPPCPNLDYLPDWDIAVYGCVPPPCPDLPEPPTWDVSVHGCEPPPPSRVVVTRTRVEIEDMVQFAVGRADILPESHDILQEVHQVLVDHPSMHLRIEGHTDSDGGAQLNLRLSQARAESVMSYLIGLGIEPDRLTAVGYGLTRPIDTNRTAAGKARNRRVEFHITQQ